MALRTKPTVLYAYKAELGAIRILAEACQEIDEDISLTDIEAIRRSDILRRAIRHLVCDDRGDAC